jgi:hypothetical protein
MFYCQLCSGDFSENGSIYILEEETLVKARTMAMERMEQNEFISHVNILASDFSFLERLVSYKGLPPY